MNFKAKLDAKYERWAKKQKAVKRESSGKECEHCHIPLRSGTPVVNRFCDVCFSMYEAAAKQFGLREAQRAFVRECIQTMQLRGQQ